MDKTPHLIGITGGIGSGKSTIAKIISALGYNIYNSDLESKRIVNTDSSLKQAIINLLGSEAYKDNVYNADYVSQQVFNDTEKIKALNQIIHPVVRQHFRNWVNNNLDKPILFKEAAILIESKSYKDLDSLILVTCPLDTRIKRLLKRDAPITVSEIHKKMKHQLSDEEKIPFADFVITNNESELLTPKVIEVINAIRQNRLKEH